MLRCNVDRSKISPMMVQYLNIKDKYPDIILFFRLGDFYEMFFEDALVASNELELTLTGKSAGLDERIPMCGIPYHAADIYINKLIDKGYKIAICEQLENPKDCKGVVKRDVVQIVSKGTITNNNILNDKDNNYIGNIMSFDHVYCLSYADITTGELKAFMIPKQDDIAISSIINKDIKELIVDDQISSDITTQLKNQFNIPISHYNITDEANIYQSLISHITDERYLKTIRQLLSYIETTQKKNLDHFEPAIIIKSSAYLKMDVNTKHNLELLENTKLKARQYSLLWLLDHTKTAMGGRKLKSWINEPLVDIDTINHRYDMVDTLLKEFIMCGELRNLLIDIYDLERLSGRIALGNANARDLIQLKNSIYVLPKIKDILIKLNFNLKLPVLDDLYQLLNISINEDAPVSLKEGYLIKTGYSSELDEIKDYRSGGKKFILNLEQEERIKTGIKNLKVGYNRIFGYYIEISKSNLNLITPDMNYERKQTLAGCERFITPILKEKEALILGAEEKIINLEYELFLTIRDQVKTYIPTLQEIAKTISEIDVLQAFAQVADDNNYIRPILTNQKIVNMQKCRHPVVEKVLNDVYVSNDIVMDENTNILLITGPNMAGKSTFMRQLAINIIMAQMGSYIPCDYAVIPIFDQIFTRIGASDDLTGGESTFMVEMNEANNALKNATDKSLILFDELGRGTATFDGMSLAQAILEYIHNNIGCKTLFSTHYHELTALDKTLKRLKNIHVKATLEDENIIFLHKVYEGSVDKSYGIHVAKLANLPNEVIKRANTVLNLYEHPEHEQNESNQTINEKVNYPSHINELETKIKNINPLEITPMEALNILFELKSDINNH